MEPIVMDIYTLALELGMDLNEVPYHWAGVEKAKRQLDPNYIIEVPNYVKFVIKYGTKWTQ